MWRFALLALIGCAGEGSDGSKMPTGTPPTDTAPAVPTGDTAPPSRDVTDDFVIGVPQVDVLMLIDDSAGMIRYQGDLYRSHTPFALTLEEVDFHLGVVTTDVVNRTPGELRTTYDGLTFIDSQTKDPQTVFTELVLAGQDGSTDERGLHSIYGLLGPEPPPNAAGFYRPEADLHILALTSEDDSSDPADLPKPSFAAWLAGLKTEGQALSFTSFVRYEGALKGQAYLDVTAAVGGGTLDIDADPKAWDEAVEALVDQVHAFPRSRSWTLSAEPDPGTLRVSVLRDTGRRKPVEIRFQRARFDNDGVLIVGEWVYDAAANTVTFQRFLPDPDDVVRISYERQ